MEARVGFGRYLQELEKTKNGCLLKARDARDSALQSHLPDSITQLLNAFPVLTPVSPFDTSFVDISEFTQNFHEIMMLYITTKDSESAADDSIGSQVKLLMKPMTIKMINAACAEILDESGKIKSEIIDVLKLQRLQNKFDSFASQFIISYIVNILISACGQNWGEDKDYCDAFVKQGIDFKTFLTTLKDEIEENLSLKIRETIESLLSAKKTGLLGAAQAKWNNLRGAVDKQKKELLDTIVSIVSASLASSCEINISNLDTISEDFQTSFSNSFTQACEEEEAVTQKFTVLGISPVTIKQMLGKKIFVNFAKKINEKMNNQIEQAQNCIIREFHETLSAESELNPILQAKINDFAVYGKPWADSFDREGLLAVHLSSYALDSLHEGYFKEGLIKEAAVYFNDLLTNPININRFVAKIILLAYANILDETGDIAERIIDIKRFELTQTKESKQAIISPFVRSFLLAVVLEWFKNTKYKIQFLNNGLAADAVSQLIATIAENLSAGLSRAFLKTLEDFPFRSARRPKEDGFAFSLVVPADKFFEIEQVLVVTEELRRNKAIIFAIEKYLGDTKSAAENCHRLYHAVVNLFSVYESYKQFFSGTVKGVFTDLQTRYNQLLDFDQERMNKQIALETLLQQLQEGETVEGSWKIYKSLIKELNANRTQQVESAEAIIPITNPHITYRASMIKPLERAFVKLNLLLRPHKQLLYWQSCVKNNGGLELKVNGETYLLPNRIHAAVSALLVLEQSLGVEFKFQNVLNAYTKEKNKKRFAQVKIALFRNMLIKRVENSRGPALKMLYDNVMDEFADMLKNTLYGVDKLNAVDTHMNILTNTYFSANKSISSPVRRTAVELQSRIR